MKAAILLIGMLGCATQLYAQSAAPQTGASATRQSARPPRYVAPEPYNFDDHTGWHSMFDGSTLNGWKGPEGLWRVEDGAIVATSTAANPVGSIYLLWAGGDVRDFEMKAEIKLEGAGANSGIQFRAQMLGKTEKKNSEWENFGYQADYDYANEQTGALIECCSGPHRGPTPRPFKADKGMVLRSGLTDADKPKLIGAFGNPDELKKYIHTGDWNQLHLIARGTTMMYILNGHLMSVFIDEDPQRFLDHGALLLQLEGRGDIKVSFRDLWLKTLP